MPLPTGFTAISDAKTAGHVVSIIGVIISSNEPKKTRGTDWSVDFTLQDDFASGPVGSSSSINCRLFFKPGPDSPVFRVRDIALVRNFKLQDWKGIMCVSDYQSRSGVLVFPDVKIPRPEVSQAYQLGGNMSLPYAATPGTRNVTVPEQMAVIQLKYIASDSMPQVQEHAAVSSFQSPARPTRDRLSLIKDLDFNRFYDLRVEIVNIYYTQNGTVELKVTDYTANKQLYYYADPHGEDADLVFQHKGFSGPYGYLTLQLILWGNNAAWVRQNAKTGDFVLLRNVRTKVSPNGQLEGAMHDDRHRPDQVDVRRLSNPKDVEEIKTRREAYEKRNGTRSAYEKIRNGASESATTSRRAQKAQKKQLQREQKEAEQRDLEKKQAKLEAERAGVNTNVLASFPEIKLSTISEILCNPHLNARSTKYNDFKLPFVNAKHRSRVRVIDVYPPEVEQFVHRKSDPAWRTHHKKPGHGMERETWEWGFVLLVEDAILPPNTVSEKLRLFVDNSAAEFLLGLSAFDPEKYPQKVTQLKEKLFILWGNLYELKCELRDRGSDLPLPPGDNRLQSRAFDCIIQEYGHQVPITERNPEGWQRMHRMAQTKIAFDSL